jgi:hypothetical protein
MARRIQGLSISEMSQAIGSSVMRLASQSERKYNGIKKSFVRTKTN